MAESVKLSVDKTSLEFTAEGGEQTFTVTASEQLYLVPGDGWVSVHGLRSGCLYLVHFRYIVIGAIASDKHRSYEKRGDHQQRHF